MAADVDKRIPEEENATPPENEPQNGDSQSGGLPSGRSLRSSWITRLISTLLMVAVVPVLAFGIKYYQDAQLLKRHVRYTTAFFLSS